jgi:hypothetical protein
LEVFTTHQVFFLFPSNFSKRKISKQSILVPINSATVSAKYAPILNGFTAKKNHAKRQLNNAPSMTETRILKPKNN